jgi:hypothetical protein
MCVATSRHIHKAGTTRAGSIGSHAGFPNGFASLGVGSRLKCLGWPSAYVRAADACVRQPIRPARVIAAARQHVRKREAEEDTGTLGHRDLKLHSKRAGFPGPRVGVFKSFASRMTCQTGSNQHRYPLRRRCLIKTRLLPPGRSAGRAVVLGCNAVRIGARPAARPFRNGSNEPASAVPRKPPGTEVASTSGAGAGPRRVQDRS